MTAFGIAGARSGAVEAQEGALEGFGTVLGVNPAGVGAGSAGSIGGAVEGFAIALGLGSGVLVVVVVEASFCGAGCVLKGFKVKGGLW